MGFVFFLDNQAKPAYIYAGFEHFHVMRSMKDEMEEIRWLYSLKDRVMEFMDHQKSRRVSGYYHYSYSGDLYDESRHWNIGASVYALKIYYTLGREMDQDIIDAANYVKTFIHPDGTIYDDFIFKMGLIRTFLSSVKHRNWANLLNTQYKRAETRQAYSVLRLYNMLPGSIRLQVPDTEMEIDRYLSRLNWREPWNAASHFSHLVFLYRILWESGEITREQFNAYTSYAIDWVNRLQHTEDGAWYRGSPSLQYRINGAMKVITGLIAADKVSFDHAQSLLDLALDAQNDMHACDNFNIVLVVNYASKVLDRDYRQSDVEQFALDRLRTYKGYYKERQGGFSFYPGKADDRYYGGVRITRGLNEADIHGTVMFLWGISMITQMLKLDSELGFREVMA